MNSYLSGLLLLESKLSDITCTCLALDLAIRVGYESNDHAALKSTTPEIHFSFPEAQRGHTLNILLTQSARNLAGVLIRS